MGFPGHDPVRAAYDAVAADYLTNLGDELAGKPLDRALLAALIEQVPAGSAVADLGCGPGHVAAWLAAQGRRVVGIDLSPAMVELGRSTSPDVEFRCGDLLALPAGDGEFGAAVALYSIIHLRGDELPVAFAEMRRVLRTGAPLLVSFHIGDEIRHRDEWWGRAVDLDFRFLEVAPVVGALEAAGFALEARLERVHHPREVETRRAYLFGRAGGSSSRVPPPA